MSDGIRYWAYTFDTAYKMFLGLNGVIFLFFAYWIYADGWQQAKTDIYEGLIMLGVVHLAWLCLSYTSWKNYRKF